MKRIHVPIGNPERTKLLVSIAPRDSDSLVSTVGWLKKFDAAASEPRVCSRCVEPAQRATGKTEGQIRPLR